MQHFDEGIFHAYLDGELSPVERQRVDEHLAACAVCRARLAEERALIQRAGDLLGALEPPMKAPPAFEEIRRKAGGRRRRPVSVPLAWAATVVLALGVGWFLRDQVMAPGDESGAVASQDRGLFLTDAQTAPRDTAPAEAAPRPESRRTRSQAALQAPADPARALEERPAAGIAAAPTPPTPAPREGAASQGALGRAAETPAPSSAIRLDAAIVQRPDDLGWRQVSLEEASEMVGAPIALVPGLPVEKVEVSAESGYADRDASLAPRARVTQRLSTEWVVRLDQRRAVTVTSRIEGERAAGRAQAQPQAQERAYNVAPTTPSLTRTMGALVVTISSPGPLTPDSLASLLAKAKQN
jgi:anti-sigma factor RsiW